MSELGPDGRGASNIIRHFVLSTDPASPREIVRDELRNSLNRIFGNDGCSQPEMGQLVREREHLCRLGVLSVDEDDAIVTAALEGQTSFSESFRLLGFRKMETFSKLANNLGLGF